MSAKQLSNDPVQDTAVGVFKTVPLTDILALPENNSRKFTPDPKKLKVLSSHLILKGQMFPLLTIERNGSVTSEMPQPYELRDGFRRFAAMQMAAVEGHLMQAIIRVFPDEGALEGYKLSMDANNPDLTEEPSLMDQAYQAHTLSEGGMQGKDIAEEMGKSKGWVSVVKKFVNFRPAIQKDIHEGRLKWSFARFLVDMDEAQQDERLGKYYAAVQAGENIWELGQEVKDKGKAKGRGRKAKGSGEAGSGKKPPSMKVLANACEEYAKERGLTRKPGSCRVRPRRRRRSG